MISYINELLEGKILFLFGHSQTSGQVEDMEFILCGAISVNLFSWYVTLLASGPM